MWQDGCRRGRAVARLLAWPSLRVRLVAAAVCLLAAGAGIITAASGLVEQRYLMQQADQQLRVYADRLISHPFLVLPLSRLAPGAAGPGGSSVSGLSIEVLGSGGQPVMSAGPGTVPGPAILAAATRVPARAGQLLILPAAGGGRCLVIAEPVHYRAQRIMFVYSAADFSVLITGRDRPGAAGTLLAVLDLASAGQAAGRLTAVCLAVSGVVILAVGCLGAWVVGGVLRPLTQIGETAGAIAAGRLSRRVAGRRAPGDIASLVSSLNRMLTQLEYALNATAGSAATARSSAEQMLRVIADTSHELHKPISVLSGLAGYCQQRRQLTPGELDRMVRRMADETARIDAMAGDLLLTCHDQPRPAQHTRYSSGPDMTFTDDGEQRTAP